MGGGGRRAKETQTGQHPACSCLPAFYLVLRFQTLALPRIPTRWHLAALSMGLRSSSPLRGRSPGWTPIQMRGGSLLPDGIKMPWGFFFSFPFLFQHRSKEERQSD